MHFRKTWICINNEKRPEISAEKCAARICITVLKVTDLTRETDLYLKFEPPLQAVIKIFLQHNHSFEVLSRTKIPREVREKFYEYFRKGIKGVKAKRLHEKNLQKINVSALNDAAMNPRMSAVYTFYRKWKQLKGNVKLKVPVSSSGSEYCLVDDAKQSLFYDSGNSDIKNNVSEFEFENEDEVGGLKHVEEDSDTGPSFLINEEIINDENKEDYELPIIVSCRSLAPGADHTAVPYRKQKVLSPLSSPSPKSSVIPAANKPVPSLANNIVSVQNNNVVSTSAGFSLVRVEPSNTDLVVYDASSNTYKVVKYLKVCSPTSASIHTSNKYSSYFPNPIQLPTRIGIQKL